jgi:acyl-lipid omega-6 desaturase (Delta-12 desaturase)
MSEFSIKVLESGVRRRLQFMRATSDLRALWHLGRGMVLYWGAFALAAGASGTHWRVLVGIGAGAAAALLFRLAHDASHGCVSPRPWVNRLLSRIFIAPSYHALSAWELFHNRRHHPYTNLKPKDYIWIPLSKAEYDRLPPLRRWLERAYRTTGGTGLYYLVEAWWRHMLFPNRRAVGYDAPETRRDSWLVVAFFALQCVLVAAILRAAHGAFTPRDFTLGVLCSTALPLVSLCWMLGFSSYFNHTHPAIPWFEDEAEWRRQRARQLLTSHIAVPWWMFLFVTDLGYHAVHHLAPRVPIHRLPMAHAVVYRGAIATVVERWRPAFRRDTLRRCKLYDYGRHRWLDFDGRVTAQAWLAPETGPARPARRGRED